MPSRSIFLIVDLTLTSLKVIADQAGASIRISTRRLNLTTLCVLRALYGRYLTWSITCGLLVSHRGGGRLALAALIKLRFKTVCEEGEEDRPAFRCHGKPHSPVSGSGVFSNTVLRSE